MMRATLVDQHSPCEYEMRVIVRCIELFNHKSALSILRQRYLAVHISYLIVYVTRAGALPIGSMVLVPTLNAWLGIMRQKSMVSRNFFF